jgi:hypothetical protein
MDDRAPPDPLRAPPDAKTLPLTMPDQLNRELAEARQKLATLELLARLRAHPEFGRVREVVLVAHADSEDWCAPGSLDEAWELLLELLGG